MLRLSTVSPAEGIDQGRLFERICGVLVIFNPLIESNEPNAGIRCHSIVMDTSQLSMTALSFWLVHRLRSEL